MEQDHKHLPKGTIAVWRDIPFALLVRLAKVLAGKTVLGRWFESQGCWQLLACKVENFGYALNILLFSTHSI
jgi:hypothetical protein